MFVLNSEITIGGFRFNGVHEVVIKRSIHSLVETAIIKIPAIATIAENGRVSTERITTARQFAEGDPVTIKLGYNGELKTEFEGFVKARKLKMPLEVECEGYSWLLKKNSATVNKNHSSLEKVLSAVTDIDDGSKKIAYQCARDIGLTGLNMKDRCGFDIISYIAKSTDSNLSFFFIEPNVLWCGLLHGDLMDSLKNREADVQYRIGYNTLRDTKLTPHDEGSKPGLVEYRKKETNGTLTIETVAGTGKTASTHNRMLNHIGDAGDLKLLAQEKVRKNTYTGYEGHIVSFLQPFTAPGQVAFVKDISRPEMDGRYLVESTEVQFGQKGARRKVELGAKIEA